MNADLMIDYVLGQLEGPDRERVERTLHSHPEAGARLDRLSLAVHLLLDDGPAAEPPPGLTTRTLARVAQSRTSSRSILDYVPVRVPLRWADFAVAASIFIAGVLTLLPAIQRSRERMALAGCGFNLQQLGKSLAQYATMYPTYPYPGGEGKDAHAGLFVAQLHDAGLLQDTSILDCPYNGPCNHPRSNLPSCDQLEEIRRTDPERYRHLLCWDYAYNAGYDRASGRPGPLQSRPPMAVPVVADAPSHENFVRILDGNSPNHARRGQNVLYSDGAVRFHPTRRVSPIDSDLYLNNQHQLRPGLDVRDAVLVPSYYPIQGFAR
jgi:hypothetical protein